MKNEKQKIEREYFESQSHGLFQPLQRKYALMIINHVSSKEIKFYIFILIPGFSRCNFVFGFSSDL